jgi:hypothetical protein
MTQDSPERMVIVRWQGQTLRVRRGDLKQFPGAEPLTGSASSAAETLPAPLDEKRRADVPDKARLAGRRA